MNEMDEVAALQASGDGVESRVLSLMLRDMARRVGAWRRTSAEHYAEFYQAVEDWGRNDEAMLAENQRLADENALLREELDKVSGGWEARVSSRAALKAERDILAWLHAEAVWLKGRERYMAETYSRLHQAVAEERSWLWTLASQLEADRDILRAQLAAQNPGACFAVGFWGSRNTRYTCSLPKDGHKQHECGDVIWFGDHTPPCSCGRCPLTPSPEAPSEASQEEAQP